MVDAAPTAAPSPAPPDILVLAAHPDLARSAVTRSFLAALHAAGLAPRVQVHDLYRRYPDFHIDAEAERRALSQAQLLVMLHPLHWYGMPALQKLWCDEVLQLGWAYGPGGTALAGKDLWLVTSTGGTAEAYSTGGHHGLPFEAFTLPYRQTARTCGMRFLPVQVLHGAHRASQAEIDVQARRFVAQLAAYPDWCADVEACPDDCQRAVGLDDRPAAFSALSIGGVA